MSNNRVPQKKTSKVLIPTHEEARKICENHGHKEAAQDIVDTLSYRKRLKPAQVTELVEAQISLFARSLVKCVERANEGAGKVENLPTRATRGQALRDIRKTLENLRDSVELNWEMAKPLLEIDTTWQFGRFLTTRPASELLPPKLRSEYINCSKDSDDYGRQQIMLAYLLEAGSRPLTRMIKRAETAVRLAEKKIPSGAPIKDPLGMALVLQLARYYEWQLRKKAAWSADGPFSRFCVEIFAAIGFPTKDSWEHVFKAGLKLHRSSLASRRLHEPHDEPQSDSVRSRKRKPRKRKLTPSSKSKIKPKQ